MARHAEAKRVTVRLSAAPEQVQLVVEDDGQGFASAEISAYHHGLVGMRERARMLGGTLEIRSSPGAGTRIEVTVPLEKL